MPNSVTKQLKDNGFERQELTLVLKYDTRVIKYFCMFCDPRIPLFATQARAIGLIYGHHIDPTNAIVPVGIPCHTCGTIYFIQAFSQ